MLKNIPEKMLGKTIKNYSMPCKLDQGIVVEYNNLLNKLKQLEQTAIFIQKRTPANFDIKPLISKVREAEAIGERLQRKANSGRF